MAPLPGHARHPALALRAPSRDPCQPTEPNRVTTAMPARPLPPVLPGLCVLTLLCPGHGAAETAAAVPPPGSLFLSALAGGQAFDAGTRVDDAGHARLGVGFRVHDTLGIELSAGRTDTHATGTAVARVNADTVQVDALHHLAPRERWFPYLVGGLGQEEISAAGGATPTGSHLNLGIGAFRPLGGAFFLRTDTRLSYVFDDNALHALFTLGVGVAIGGTYAGPQATTGPQASAATPTKETETGP